MSEGADVTAVRITINGNGVAHWERLRDPEGPVRLGVDFGIAGIFDVADAQVANDLAYEEGLDILAPLYEYRDTPWYMWHEGVLAFRCGRGDGNYDIWVGRDSSGRLASVVLDLELLPMPPEGNAPDALRAAASVSPLRRGHGPWRVLQVEADP
jgi:hypothetical protein